MDSAFSSSPSSQSPPPKCGNVSFIFAGDSRVRALFGAALTVAYPTDTKVHRYLDDLHPQTISIKNLTSSNYVMAQRLGGLQKDMWTYKVNVCIL